MIYGDSNSKVNPTAVTYESRVNAIKEKFIIIGAILRIWNFPKKYHIKITPCTNSADVFSLAKGVNNLFPSIILRILHFPASQGSKNTPRAIEITVLSIATNIDVIITFELLSSMIETGKAANARHKTIIVILRKPDFSSLLNALTTKSSLWISSPWFLYENQINANRTPHKYP